MRIVLALAILTASTASYAGDSNWLLCKSTGKEALVASLFEHRNDAGDGRALSVTLIRGDHVTRGDIANLEDKPAALEVVEIGAKLPMFKGTGQLPNDMKTFTIKGKLDKSFGTDPKAKLEAFTAKLSCSSMN